MSALSEKTGENLTAVIDSKPLVHNITNYVVMNSTANTLLAMGASPVMAHAVEEVEEMVSLAGSLVLNIGTLSEDWITAMFKAGKKAEEMKIPIVFDPVGSGATSLRTDTARKIISEIDLQVVRGNASEILSLVDSDSRTRGVDSIDSAEDAAGTAMTIARQYSTVIAVTGPVDIVTDGSRIVKVFNGDPLMNYVTGMGCAATAVIGAFLAVDDDPLSAAATALAFFGLAGEKAAEKTSVPGSFMVELLNALYSITAEACRIECRFADGD
jgi:hydroxyethylthiazole kinase